MDKDTELTVYLLRYLLENRIIRSKSEIANELGVSKRQIQRIMNDPEGSKGSTIALSKILRYFGLHRIPFEPVLLQYLEMPMTSGVSDNDAPAYMQIRLPVINGLGIDGAEAYEYSHQFVGLMSSFLCPHCRTWCNPWAGDESVLHHSCLVAHTARSLLASIQQEYGEGCEAL